MQCIDIRRRQGPHGTTQVIVTRGGKEYVFSVGRHVGARRIYELVETSAIRTK